jgi:hypothetical protein
VLSFLEKQRDNFTFTGTYLSFFPLLFTLNVILPFTLSLTILVSAWLGKKKEYTSFTGANKGKNIDLFFVSLLIYSYLFLYFVLFFSSSFTYFFYSLSLSVSICVPNGISSTPDIRANTSIARSRSPQPWCTTWTWGLHLGRESFVLRFLTHSPPIPYTFITVYINGPNNMAFGLTHKKRNRYLIKYFMVTVPDLFMDSWDIYKRFSSTLVKMIVKDKLERMWKSSRGLL